MMKKIDFQKYMHHQLTEEETRQLYEWLCESKENQQAWFSLKEAWLHQEYEKEKLEADTQNEWKKFADRPGISPQTTRRRSIRTTWLYAASILLCLVIGWQAERLFTPQTESYPVIVETETGQQAKVKLPDGSSVWLNACSTLSYTTGNWKKERNVTLHGEAIFDVKSQNGKPFYVHTAHYKIKVLGTNFDVSAYTNEEQSRVTLLKGKVEISPDFTSQKTILSPGESFLCQPKDSTFQKIQIPVGSVYAWREKTVIFDGHTLEDKRGELYRHYGYQFLLSSSAKKLKYKATLRDESLDEFLSTLKFLSPGIRYRINHEQKKIWITDYKDE